MIVPKIRKKLLSNFWRKHQTDGQTDRQADNSDFKALRRQAFGDYLFSTYTKLFKT